MSSSTDDRKTRDLHADDQEVVDDEEAKEMPELLAAVNASIHDLAAGRLGGGAHDTWDFRCECGSPACDEVVSLPLVEYEALRGNNSPVVAPGHRFLLAGTVRERSAQLREEATALRNQARQQYDRAQRNRDLGLP